MNCVHTVKDGYSTRTARPCRRAAKWVVNGRPCCTQHRNRLLRKRLGLRYRKMVA